MWKILLATKSQRLQKAAVQMSAPSTLVAPNSTAQTSSEGSVPNADAPDAASGGTMGVVLGVGTNNDNPAAEGDAPEAAAIEEEPKIEEINRAPKETVQPQCIHVARKRHGEWVFHADRAVRKLQRTVDDLMSQIKTML